MSDPTRPAGSVDVVEQLRRIATDWPACSREDARHLFAAADELAALRKDKERLDWMLSEGLAPGEQRDFTELRQGIDRCMEDDTARTRTGGAPLPREAARGYFDGKLPKEALEQKLIPPDGRKSDRTGGDDTP